MSTSKVGKAVGETMPKLVPVLLWVGVGYLVYKLVKDAGGSLSNLFSGFAASPKGDIEQGETLPLAPDSAGVVAATIIEPANNGVAKRALFGATYPMRIEVTNPGSGDKRVTLQVKAEEFPPWPLSKTVSTVTETITLKPGRNVVNVTMPVTSTLLLGGSDAWAQVYIDRQAASQAVIYRIE